MCKRNPSVELLRIILMFMIVFGHSYADNMPIANPSVDGLWSFVFILFTWHVDCFVAISGYYGIRLSWRSVSRMIGIFLFYGVIRSLYIAFVLEKGFCFSDFQAVTGWFGSCYLMLMFIAPILNFGCEAALQKSRKTLLIVWVSFAVAMTLSWFPLTAKWFGIRPYGFSSLSLLVLVFVYVTARTVRLLGVTFSRKLMISGLVLFLFSILTLGGLSAYRTYLHHYVVSGFAFGLLSSYDAPHVWIMAICMLLLFIERIHLPPQIGGVICFLSPSVFPVYLLHQNIHPTLTDWLMRNPENYLMGQCHLHPLLSGFLVSLWAFSFCLMFDIVRRLLLQLLGCLKRRALP